MLHASSLALRSHCLAIGFAFVAASCAHGQCLPAWQTHAPEDDVDGRVYSAVVMPNGDLVAGGWFVAAGGATVNSIARWDGSAWSALGVGMTGDDFEATNVTALAVMPNGDLIAGGYFNTAGGNAANGIARWNGSTWSPLASGMNSSSLTSDLVVLPNGDLVAAGFFTTAGGVEVNGIAKWNGTTWSALGSGLTGTDFPGGIAIVQMPNGDLVVGGNFTLAGGVPANYIARWNGTTWSALGSGMNDWVRTLAVMPNGDLIAGGFFSIAGGVGARRIAKWNGSAWSSVGTGMNATSFEVDALAVMPNGDLVAAGDFGTAGGVSASNIARWNGTAWSAMGLGTGDIVRVLTPQPNGDLFVGGDFSSAGGVISPNYAVWGLAPACRCDSIDFNNDGLFPDDSDLIDFLSVLAGGPCSTNTCHDIDFNNDDLFPDDNDLVSFLRVLAGGACLPD